MSYEDDYYTDPTAMDNDDFMPFNPHEDAESDYSSVSTNRKKQRKYRDELNNIDKGYHKLKRSVNFKRTDIEVYSTGGLPGTMIRDAVTGARYKEYRVGSRNEHLFFKVALATGELGINGGSLFFDSPEQFERHFKNISFVSQVDKERWTNKCAEIRKITA